ncbi:DUF58 domain-containing protein [Glaciihabitans sp. UYNi722]|uniref:DUF58 domain-containing protein n=1 Tax=Glaciihabitans sp. UYNi722 TaxID=3156344 RepID=UPI00339B6E9C
MPAQQGYGPRNPKRQSKRRRRATRVARFTRRGWFLLVLAAVSLPSSYALGRRELLYLGCFLALLPLLALAFVRWRRVPLSVARSFSPPVVGAGHPSIVTVEVNNLAPASAVDANWRDSLPWEPHATAPTRLQPAARRSRLGGVTRLRYEVVPPRRGFFEIGPMLVDFTDPFGLADGALAVGRAQTLIVTPDVVQLSDDVISIAADEGPSRIMQRRALGGDDDLMTREYRTGDAIRRVHWRASAHHGELMVRQEEQRSHAEARLVFDTQRGNYRDAAPIAEPGDIESRSFEWAVAFVASLGLHLQRSGVLVQVIETGPTQLAGIERPEEFLESLAAVELVDGAPVSLSLLRNSERPDRSQGSIFAVVSDADPDVLERLVAQRRSFDLAVAFLIAPSNGGLAETLRDAGWMCVAVDPDAPVEYAWMAVEAEQEANRGRA